MEKKKILGIGVNREKKEKVNNLMLKLFQRR